MKHASVCALWQVAQVRTGVRLTERLDLGPFTVLHKVRRRMRASLKQDKSLGTEAWREQRGASGVKQKQNTGYKNTICKNTGYKRHRKTSTVNGYLG